MKFSEFCFTAILSREFELLWSDNNFIFRRMLMGKKKLVKHMNNIHIGVSVQHSFKVDGVHYSAKIERMCDNMYICRASEMISEQKMNSEELVNDLDSIRFGTLNALSSAQLFESYHNQSDYDRAYNHFLCQRSEMMNIFSASYNLIKMLESKDDIEYEQLARRLLITEDIINHVTKPIKKRISFGISIDSRVAEIDYTLLELAIYNIAKLALVFTLVGSFTLIELTQESDDILSVSFRVPIQQNQFTNNYRLESRVIKYIFEKFGGKFDFYQETSNLCGSGYMLVNFSDDISVIPEKERLIFNKSVLFGDEWKTDDEYNRLFIPKGRSYLKQPVTPLQGITDTDVQFAEMFLLGYDASQ